MAGDVVTPVELHQLGVTRPIDRGGVGEILGIDDYQLSGFSALVFKKYFEPMTLQDTQNLQGLIEFRAALPLPDRELLDELFTWPLQLVTDGGKPVGCIMKLIGDEWKHQLTLTRNPVEMRQSKWLIAPAASAALAGVEVPEPGADLSRLVLCTKLARAFALLHRDGIVYGDLQPANVLYLLEPVPRLLVVDCDSAKAATTADDFVQPWQQLWLTPEGANPQTIATDRYKLALFVLRCIADGPGSHFARDPDRAADDAPGIRRGLDADGLDLLYRGLSDEPDERPSAKQWYGYLRRLVNDLTQPPRISRIEVSERIVLAGTLVTVNWEALGAEQVTLETSDGHQVEIDVPSTTTGSADVPVFRSGPVVVNASNDFGTSREYSVPVAVFEPPRLTVVNVPEPPLPSQVPTANREVASTLRTALQSTPPAVDVSLPVLPAVALDELSATTSYLGTPALDHLLDPVFLGLTQAMDAIGETATRLLDSLGEPATSERVLAELEGDQHES